MPTLLCAKRDEPVAQTAIGRHTSCDANAGQVLIAHRTFRFRHEVIDDGALERSAEMREFALRLIEGTRAHQKQVDEILVAVTRNWDLRRMAAIDRNILRMAIYELLHCADIPPKVTINEAIELGKRFSTANSGAFINGILDRVRIDIDKGAVLAPARPPLEQSS